MPLRAARRFEERIPHAPSAAPATHVQINLLSAPVIAKYKAAITHATVPKVIRVTTDLISDLFSELPFELTKEAYKRWR